jgi:2-dehydropantoate 2-reductase
LRFLVMGAGSIGSVVGGFLHMGGHDVYLVGIGPHIEAVASSGLSITGIWGDHGPLEVDAGSSVGEMREHGFEPEWTLLSVKSYDTEKAMSDLGGSLTGQNGVVSLQNGLGNVEAIAEAAPGMAVGGRVIFGARTLEPGRVEVTVCADDVLLGPAQGGPVGVEEVVAAFAGSGIPCRFESRILTYIWDKVLYNVCLNALATLLRTNYGNLGDNPETWVAMETLVGEFYAVAASQDVELVSPDPAAYLERFRDELLPPTREHRSSMQEDIERGRRTEIEALNGAVWRMGAERGVPTPANELLTRMIRFRERSGQKV